MKEKLKELYFKIIGPIKAKKFKFTDFTIISNNCFGGTNHHLLYLTLMERLFIKINHFNYYDFTNNKILGGIK